MSVYIHPLSRAVPGAVRHLAWFAGVCAVAFLVPYLGVSVLDLQHDLFYLVYFAITIAVVVTYVRVERVDVAEIFRGRRRWSLGVGVILAAFLVFNVFKTADGTARPRGAYFVFELLWRGVGYGIVDTLLLTIFPCFVAYRLLRGQTGNVLISVPTFATANPVGSIVAHVSQHITAVTHAYESRIFNPPVTTS
jgi:hypothetical protein